MSRKSHPAKRFIVGGAIVGGIASVTITLLMDVLYAESLQGTWRDAIAKDLNGLFHAALTPDSAIVYMTYFVIILILMGVGMIMGVFFAMIVYRFLRLLGAGQ